MRLLLPLVLLLAAFATPLLAATPQSTGSIAWRIDTMAGHPEDPQLPKGVFGASDQVLEATNPREVADLLQEGADFARKNADSPRFLFALGRAAMAHGYGARGKELLVEAASKGSAAASASLAYAALDEGEPEQAAKLLQRAIEAGFASARATSTLARISGPGGAKAGATRFRAEHFNRPEWIQALHDGNPAPLENGGLDALIYTSGMNNLLGDAYTVVLTGNPKLFLELDPHLSYLLGKKLAGSQDVVGENMERGVGGMLDMLTAMGETRRAGGGVVAELSSSVTAGMERMEPTALAGRQAEQDGRRLALLYNTDPLAFRRIYHGLRMFAYGADAMPHEAGRTTSASASSGANAWQGANSNSNSNSNANASESTAKPPAAADDPVSMYERLNADSRDSVPALFRLTDRVAYICGKDPATGNFLLERIDFSSLRTDKRYAKYPGPKFALSAYGRRFPNSAALVEACESAPLQPNWGLDGPLRPAVERVLIERSINVPAVQKAAANGRPLFFRAQPGSDIVHLGFDNGAVYTVYVAALQEHLACVDAVIAKTGSWFGVSREEQLARMGKLGTAAGVAMRTCPDQIPSVEVFIAAADQASVRPEFYR